MKTAKQKKAPVRAARISDVKPPSARHAGRRIDTSSSQAALEPRARIRVYRHGLGDCILVRLKRKRGEDYKILIDCGVAMATEDAATKMIAVVEDIKLATGNEIDVLAVTHEHWDHVSGFTQAEAAFASLEVGEVWVAWTEDKLDDLANELREKQAKALKVLGASVEAMALAGSGDRSVRILNVLGMLGAAGEKTRTAFDKATAMGKKSPKLRYWQPDPHQALESQQKDPIELADPKVTIYALGPPHEASLLRKTLPSKANPETFEFKLGAAGVFPADAVSALIDDQDPLPFAHGVPIPMEIARGMPFFQKYYWGVVGGEDWRRIDLDWLGASDELALAMQGATNNTSLVFAIELAGGDVLLFAGDAQVGNWLSWHDRKWTVGGREVTGPDLLARTIFYKVGHHGSHNATLQEKGLDLMQNLQFAVIPVDQIVAEKMGWGAMPLESLVAALNAKTRGKTLRTDVKPANPITGVTVEELYYEIIV